MIETYLRAFHVLTDEEIENAIQLFYVRVLNKSDYFIREGQTCKEAAFIVSGIFRSFYVSDGGTETTYCIMFPGNLLTAYSSFITNQGTPENIQAITSAELMVISKIEIDKLAEKSANWLKLLKIIAEQQYIELENRVFQLQRNNAIERYLTLLKNQPEYIRHIPLHYLASYLGITQRHLSRIRKQVSF